MDQNLAVQSRQQESERRKEANSLWVTQPAFALQESARNREREREKDTGTQVSGGTRVLY